MPIAERAAVDALVGRASDLAAIAVHFANGARLVTVFGAAGVGKTRVAREISAHADRFGMGRRTGAVLSDLAEANTPQAAGLLVSAALGAPCSGAADAVGHVGDVLAHRARPLVVLDGFDYLVSHASATVGRWLARAPETRFLVTSREVLRLSAEIVHELEPLPPPARNKDVLTSPAVQLLLARVRRRRGDFTVTTETATTIAEIVRRLDGLPLAIELLAPRLDLADPMTALEWLHARFQILANGPRDASDQHRTLRAALDGSWDLLTPSAKAALAQCSVFRGGFTLDATEEVIDLAAYADAPPVLDLLQSLRDKSLLRVERTAGGLRLGMLECVREYAADRLAEMGETTATERRHEAWCARAAAAKREGARETRTSSAPIEDALEVHAGGRWFVPPSGARVNCGRRGPMRRMLVRLAETRQQAPGVAIPAQTLLDTGWPGERVAHLAAMSRLWTSLSRLRKLGLGGVLLSGDDGYLLDPRVPLRIVRE